ncbi:MAG: LysR family transcriptional regulator [Mailhella sp.]|nr:LysR family transcriptional regulator [Mailhella sp.]
MEFRALKYFLAVAKTGNITHAADQVFVSQPALSRQLMDLEEDLGVKLLERGKRHTALTEAGYLLKKRAEEIMALMDKTVDELSHTREGVSGSVRIGCGETEGMRTVARAIHDIRREYPHVRCHLSSMDGSGVRERLDKGMLDFGVLVQPDPPNDYEHVEIGHTDRWGILMRRDSPLAALERIAPGDLAGQPLVISQQAFERHELVSWFAREESELDIAATYTLIYNASLLAEEGVGCVLTLDRLLNLPPDGPLVFRPLFPQRICRIFFVWKRNQVFSRAASLLRERIIQATDNG